MNKILKNKFIITLLVLSMVFIIIVSADKKSITAAKIGGYNALKYLEKTRVSEFTQEFEIYNTKHFIIKYKKADETIVVQIGEMFERSYVLIGQAYNYYPKDKTTVMLYRTKAEFWQYHPSLRGQEIMGLYSAGIIHILSPNAYNSEDENFLQKFEKDGPILHEYTHSVIDSLTRGNVDLWFTEGLALYEEYDQLGTEWAANFEYDDYYTLEELQKDFMKIDEVQAYRQSFEIVRSIVELHGREKLLEFLNEMKNLNNFQKAYEKVYGEKLEYIIFPLQ